MSAFVSNLLGAFATLIGWLLVDVKDGLNDGLILGGRSDGFSERLAVGSDDGLKLGSI